MRWVFVIAFLGVAGLIAGVAAQTPPSPPAIVRTVVAATKLPSLDDAPLYFKAVSVSIAPGQKISLSGPNGIVYQLSGSTEVSAAEAKTMQGGQSAVREIRLLRSMSGVWRRSYGRPTKAPPDEWGGNRHGRPNTTAPHPDSTQPCGSTAASGMARLCR